LLLFSIQYLIPNVIAAAEAATKTQEESRLPVTSDLVSAAVENAASIAPHEQLQQVCLYEALVMNGWQRLLIALVGIATAGIGFFLLAPVFYFSGIQQAVDRIRIGNKRLKFTGELTEFWMLNVENGLLAILTLGFYSLLGYAERRVAKYIDSHLHVVD